jgi:hypothetical protein
MIDTDKYESMRLLFLDFIDTASDEVDEEAWRNKLTMLDDLLAEVKRLRKLEDVVREAFSEDSKYASGEYMNIMGEILGVIER